jgi:hypothetical protein
MGSADTRSNAEVLPDASSDARMAKPGWAPPPKVSVVGTWQNRIGESFPSDSIVERRTPAEGWLPREDSNLGSRIQSPLSYH